MTPRIVFGVILTLTIFTAPVAAQAPQPRREVSETEMLLAGAQANRVDVVVYLLDKGVDPNITAKGGYTALIVAAAAAANDVIDLLLARGADVNKANDEGWTALMEAAQRDREETVPRLLKAGAKLDLRSKRDGLTPLMIAARADSPSNVAAMIKAGADINAIDEKRGLTALHFALASRQLKSLELSAEILGAGADATRAARDGFTPLMAAIQSDMVEKVSLVLSEKIDVNAERVDGRSALMLAAAAGQAAMVKALLQAGAKQVSISGETIALIEAIRGDSLNCAELLIDRGAEVNRPGKDGRSPLILAAQNGNDELVKLLLDKGAGINSASEKDGTTALMWAANAGYRSLVEMLVSRGADARTKARDGWTASQAARQAGHDEIADLLERKI